MAPDMEYLQIIHKMNINKTTSGSHIELRPIKSLLADAMVWRDKIYIVACL